MQLTVIILMLGNTITASKCNGTVDIGVEPFHVDVTCQSITAQPFGLDHNPEKGSEGVILNGKPYALCNFEALTIPNNNKPTLYMTCPRIILPTKG